MGESEDDIGRRAFLSQSARIAGGAMNNGRPLGRPPHKNSKTALAQPGDEQHTWTRERL